MKPLKILLAVAFCGLFSSCFKDEPLNAECDIEQAYVHVDNPTDIFYSVTDTLVNVLSDVTDITFSVKAGVDLTAMSPLFRITEGATISPANGSTHDFSNKTSVTYTVTSQDGKWSRVYSVKFEEYTPPLTEFSFEYYYLTDGANGGQYYVWSDLNEDGSEMNNWATGNPGFNLSMGSTAAPDEYPSVMLPNGYQGAGVQLTTRSTGPLGALVGRRLAAGNLFLGYFDLSSALTNTLQSTNFGLPFDHKPLRLTAYYKYSRGDSYQDEDGNIIDVQDMGNIYGVFYLNHDSKGNALVLHGDDIKSSSQIVAIADIGGLDETDEWTELNVDFVYNMDVDDDLLASQGYSLAIVCTSSFYGASFRGAIGSSLCVDEINVLWEEETSDEETEE